MARFVVAAAALTSGASLLILRRLRVNGLQLAAARPLDGGVAAGAEWITGVALATISILLLCKLLLLTDESALCALERQRRIVCELPMALTQLHRRHNRRGVWLFSTHITSDSLVRTTHESSREALSCVLELACLYAAAAAEPAREHDEKEKQTLRAEMQQQQEHGQQLDDDQELPPHLIAEAQASPFY